VCRTKGNEVAVPFVRFGVLLVEWLVFCGVMLWSPQWLDRSALLFLRLPVLAKIVVVIVLLPLALGLWVWRRVKWPLMERRLIIAVMAVLWCFGTFPRAH
jgi:hypothetical protein